MATILTICPYKLLPLRGGGALRCFHLLLQLARYHEIHAIIFQKEEELREETNGFKIPNFVNIYSSIDSPPPQSFFEKLPGRVGPGLHFRWLRRSMRGPAESTLLRCYHLIKKIVTNNKIDVAIFEHISSMHAAPIVKRLSPKTKRILDAHNVDHLLLKQELNLSKRTTPVTKATLKSLKHTQWIEHHLGNFVHSFFTCSDKDREILEKCSGVKGVTIPNGVDTDYFKFDKNEKKANSSYLIFAGWMGTKANQDAIEYLISMIWPLVRKSREDLKLFLVGGGMPSDLSERAKNEKNIIVVGEVPDVRPFFLKSSLSLVPMRIGSGTRLKILEAMSQGNPVVSTFLGAEGLNVTHGKNIFLANEPENFVKFTLQLLSDELIFKKVQDSGRKLVEKNYNWDLIGQTIINGIDFIQSDLDK